MTSAAPIGGLPLGFLRNIEGSHALESSRVTIGRGSKSSVRLDSRSVSTDHAMIEFIPDGAEGRVRAILHDLNSRNGTLVNDRRLRNASCALKDGDALRFGYDDAGALVFNLAERSLERSRSAPNAAPAQRQQQQRRPRTSQEAEPGYGRLPVAGAPDFDVEPYRRSVKAARARRPAGTSSPLATERSVGTFVHHASASSRSANAARAPAGVATQRRRKLSQRSGGVARYIELEELPLGAHSQAELSRARIAERKQAQAANAQRRTELTQQQRSVRAAGVRSAARDRETAADIIYGGVEEVAQQQQQAAAAGAAEVVLSSKRETGSTPPHAKTTPRRDAMDAADAPLFAPPPLAEMPRPRGASQSAEFELVLTAAQRAMEAGRDTALRVEPDAPERGRFDLPMQQDGWPLEVSTDAQERERRLREADATPLAQRQLGDSFGGLLDAAEVDDSNVGGTRRKRAASKVDRSEGKKGGAEEGGDDPWGDAAAEELELRALRSELSVTKANMAARTNAGVRERRELRFDSAQRHSANAEASARAAARSAATYAEIASAAVEYALLRDDAVDAERERVRQEKLARGVRFEDEPKKAGSGVASIATQNSAFARIGKEAFFQAVRHSTAAEAAAVAASAAAAARLAAAVAQVAADESATLLNLDEKIESAAQASLQMQASAADMQRREAGARARALDDSVLTEAKRHADAANKVAADRKELQLALRQSADSAALVEEKEAATHAAQGVATEAELEEHRAQLRTLRTQLGAAREAVGTIRQQLRLNSVEEQRSEERIEGLQTAAHAAREEEIRAGIEAQRCTERLAGDMRETIQVQRDNATNRAQWLSRKRNWVGGEEGAAGGEEDDSGNATLGGGGPLFAPEDAPYLTEDEKLREIFDNFDHDKSGTICIDELGQVLEALGMQPTPKRLQAMIAAIDKDRDGEISFTEFRAMLGRKGDKQIDLDDADLEAGRQRRWRQLVRDGMTNGELDGALATVRAEVMREEMLARKKKQERADAVRDAENQMRIQIEEELRPALWVEMLEHPDARAHFESQIRPQVANEVLSQMKEAMDGKAEGSSAAASAAAAAAAVPSSSTEQGGVDAPSPPVGAFVGGGLGSAQLVRWRSDLSTVLDCVPPSLQLLDEDSSFDIDPSDADDEEALLLQGGVVDSAAAVAASVEREMATVLACEDSASRVRLVRVSAVTSWRSTVGALHDSESLLESGIVGICDEIEKSIASAAGSAANQDVALVDGGVAQLDELHARHTENQASETSAHAAAAREWVEELRALLRGGDSEESKEMDGGVSLGDAERHVVADVRNSMDTWLSRRQARGARRLRREALVARWRSDLQKHTPSIADSDEAGLLSPRSHLHAAISSVHKEIDEELSSMPQSPLEGGDYAAGVGAPLSTSWESVLTDVVASVASAGGTLREASLPNPPPPPTPMPGGAGGRRASGFAGSPAGSRAGAGMLGRSPFAGSPGSRAVGGSVFGAASRGLGGMPQQNFSTGASALAARERAQQLFDAAHKRVDVATEASESAKAAAKTANTQRSQSIAEMEEVQRSVAAIIAKADKLEAQKKVRVFF